MSFARGGLVAGLLVGALLGATSHAAEVRTRLGGVEAVAWTPPSDPPWRPWPVVVFSHGFGMCPTQARFLTSALASAGYLVIAPYHADSTCELSVDLVNGARLPLKPAGLWSDADYRDRAQNVRDVLRALPADPLLGASADATSVALVGHSLGGYTVLGLAGAWPGWPTPAGVQAVVALAPYALPLLQSGALGQLRVPVMFEVGTQDPTFTLPVTAAGGAYEKAPAPKALVTIEYATHFAWTDAGLLGREAIVAATLAFLDHYVRGEPERAALRGAIDGVDEWRRDPPPSFALQPKPARVEQALDTMRDWLQRARAWWPFGR